MAVFQTHSVQIWPRNKFQAVVKPCGADKWLRIYGDEEEICAYLIVDATADEMQVIANAFNAPHLRMKREDGAGKAGEAK